MVMLLLAIIYLAFIGLGLPDSLLGAAWPVMHVDLSVSLSSMGIITMIISAGTIISSLMSDYLTKKLGAGLVTATSVFLTAMALFGFSVSDNFIILCLWSVPYGIGAGAVDAALNNYVAVNYSSRHMSWLHCFWGVGAAVSPYIMGACLKTSKGWSGGYLSVSIIQIVISIILFSSLPLWKKRLTDASGESPQSKGIFSSFKIKGVPYVMLTFFGYCSLESTAGLWAASYFVVSKDISAKTAAGLASLFYIGITVGRFISGFVADKLGDRRFIRIGMAIIAVGIICMFVPVETDIVSFVGLIVIGLGCAPIYPCIIHSTPSNFGKENSQAIIGIQMASAYVGTTLMPPFFGVLAKVFGMNLFPIFLLCSLALLVGMSEKLNRTVKLSAD